MWQRIEERFVREPEGDPKSRRRNFLFRTVRRMTKSPDYMNATFPICASSSAFISMLLRVVATPKK
jgi:hypothetical protein